MGELKKKKEKGEWEDKRSFINILRYQNLNWAIWIGGIGAEKYTSSIPNATST